MHCTEMEDVAIVHVYTYGCLEPNFGSMMRLVARLMSTRFLQSLLERDMSFLLTASSHSEDIYTRSDRGPGNPVSVRMLRSSYRITQTWF